MLDHLHLLVQGTAETQWSELDVKNILLDIVSTIDMEILGGPNVYRSDVSGNEGYTALMAITTSHIVMHSWDTGLIQLDVYSCKKFNISDVVKVLNKFNILNIKTKFLDRSNGFIDLAN